MRRYDTAKPEPRSIIDVREDMIELAADLERGHVSNTYAAGVLRKLAEATKRKAPISVARKRHAPLSDKDRQAIRTYHHNNPELSQLEIANAFGTNPGRVSEALNEYRHA